MEIASVSRFDRVLSGLGRGASLRPVISGDSMLKSTFLGLGFLPMSLKKSSALTGCFMGDEAGLLGTGAGAGASFFFDLLNKNIFSLLS